MGSAMPFWLWPVLAGVLSHVYYFRIGEHHRLSLFYVQCYVLVSLVATIGLRLYTEQSQATFVQGWFALYALSTWTSMLIYRSTILHPLYRYPGPLSWRLTKFVQSWNNRNLRGMVVVDELHRKYGEYVRTGPTELSITDPDSIAAIHGPSSKCIRAPWYNMALPLQSVFETRDRRQHDKRRRIWDMAFNTKALAHYEARIKKHVHELVYQLRNLQGRPVNVTPWSNYFSFDVIGDLAFNHHFEMLSSERNRAGVQILADCQEGLPVVGSLPWLFPILTSLPAVSKPFYRMVNWCHNLTLDREKRKVEQPDIMTHLLKDHAAQSDSADARMWLAGDSRIVTAAGSAAVASTLTFSLYHLAKNESHICTIRKELSAISHGEGLSAKSLQSPALYLNAFILEVLRLYPPNPSGFLRQTPKEGLHIGERHIPGGVTLCTPLWSLHRSSKCFGEALEFIPERWLTRQELVLRKEGFVPFGHGPYNCVGKQLALMELRLALAQLVMQFDISFAEGETGETLLEKTADNFTLAPSDLILRLSAREKEGI